MKKLFYILIFFFPVVAFAQQPWFKSSPLNYAWKNIGNVGFTTGWATYCNLAISPTDGQPYVAYSDYTVTNKANVMKFDGNNWIFLGTPNFSAAGAWNTSLAFSPLDGQPYIAFTDAADSAQATVMKFDGTNWVNVGNAGFSLTSADYTCLAFSPSGEPYVAFSSSGYKATVMKFDGTNWVYVGPSSGFSSSQADWLCLAFSPSGEPYVAFKDWWLPIIYNATVMKFDGTNWVYVGNEGFSTDDAEELSLAFSPSGQPYVAYSDNANPYSPKATVMRFDGTSWVSVGDTCFSTNGVGDISLAFSLSGQPYVACAEWITHYIAKATVMKFDGTNWLYVGPPSGFSEGSAGYINLAFNQSGEPYVAYMDYQNDHKATVMKFDSVAVGINQNSISGLTVYPNPAIDKIIVENSNTISGNLSIENLTGQKLLTQQVIEAKTQIDISNLPNGVYFVKHTSNKNATVAKFIKQ